MGFEENHPPSSPPSTTSSSDSAANSALANVAFRGPRDGLAASIPPEVT